MRRSEFERAVDDEFGSQAGVLLADLVLGPLGGMTAAEAIAAGVPPREVWQALCAETDVPLERRYGVGRLEPRR
ncbi:DUF3046 domain-containing protein [Microbacterium terricola]|uniref:Signal transduction histidine kinase n=1 Tax=Microbacterium terricola TaxID=344163 RepID=A0ABM8DX61_9MICO|nr:DUF3046 domain-containing protein [Microbacterium terricola]UYK39034.1 DUF3046 domain-containing protein [Microbacterium terricola]BDV30258.1 hypothetical protein Microterr_09180 [Microbacterium terricola]